MSAESNKPYLIWLPVLMVSVMLALNFYFLYYNQQVIKYNHDLQTEAESIRSDVAEVLWETIQGIDLGIRGYALVREDRFVEPYESALSSKDSLFADIEQALERQGFDMETYHSFEQSMNDFIEYSGEMKKQLDAGNDAVFLEMLYPDKGEDLWELYVVFSEEIESFESRITQEAEVNHKAAVKNLYIAQVALLLVLIPTLFLYVYYFRNSILVSNQLADYQEEKSRQIIRQNEKLEEKVQERTQALRMQMSIIQAQQEDLIATNEAKDKIFTVISHDLRGPLGNLQNTLSGFRKSLFSPEDSAVLLEKLETSFHQTNELLNNLLIWSKSQITGINVEKTQFSLSACVDELVEFFAESAKDKRISLVNTSEENVTVLAGKDMIDMVLRNLMSNAIKFTPKKGTITLQTKSEGEMACFEISDTGVGMSKEAVENIMSAGFASSSTLGTNNEKGTGMGLILVKEFIKLHNGTLTVESKEAQGTTFKFSIPKA